MLNTLANHGLLPHNGKALTRDTIVGTLDRVLNINTTFGDFLFDQALTNNPQPNATVFDLDHLGRHNILEHDASLSRADFFFGGNVLSFNQSVFDQTRSYWTDPDTISLQMSANGKLARVLDSNATNPTFTLSELGSEFAFGEVAAYIFVFGDRAAGTAPKKMVEFFFGAYRPSLVIVAAPHWARSCV